MVKIDAELIDLLETAECDYRIKTGKKHTLIFVNEKLAATLSRRPKDGRHMANSRAMLKRFLRRECLL